MFVTAFYCLRKVQHFQFKTVNLDKNCSMLKRLQKDDFVFIHGAVYSFEYIQKKNRPLLLLSRVFGFYKLL